MILTFVHFYITIISNTTFDLILNHDIKNKKFQLHLKKEISLAIK